MAIVTKIKNSQKYDAITKFKFQSTWYVDEAMIDGLKANFFCAVHGDGLSDGKSEGTLTYAGAADKTYTLSDASTVALTKKRADGIVYTASARDRYGRTDDMEDNAVLFPYGKREGIAIGLLKNAVVELSDSSKTGSSAGQFRYYYTKTASLGTPTTETNVGDGTSLLIFNAADKTEDIKVGNKVLIAGDNKVAMVTAVAYASGNTTVTVNVATDGTASEVFTQSQIGDPIFLAKDMSGELPWTTVQEATTGNIDQPVGYIESPIAVRIDLSNTNPTVVA